VRGSAHAGSATSTRRRSRSGSGFRRSSARWP
jgi:hypothetical protein